MVRTLFKEAEAGFAKVERGISEEALHDFRVSLRRLRTLARAFRPSLSKQVRRKLLQRLGAYPHARLTRRGRRTAREDSKRPPTARLGLLEAARDGRILVPNDLGVPGA